MICSCDPLEFLLSLHIGHGVRIVQAWRVPEPDRGRTDAAALRHELIRACRRLVTCLELIGLDEEVQESALGHSEVADDDNLWSLIFTFWIKSLFG